MHCYHADNRGRVRTLNLPYLVENDYLSPSAEEFSTEYKRLPGRVHTGVFAGQSDSSGRPNGLVRVLYQCGWIYEGQMTPDGKRNGWGILYWDGCEYWVGWWAHGYLTGNGLKGFDDGTGREEGWFEQGKLKGPSRLSDKKYKHFNFEDCFSLDKYEKNARAADLDQAKRQEYGAKFDDMYKDFLGDVADDIKVRPAKTKEQDNLDSI